MGDDVYDEAVKYFLCNKKEIRGAWLAPRRHKYGYLFGYLNNSRKESFTGTCCNERDICGCATQVAIGVLSSSNAELDHYVHSQLSPQLAKSLVAESTQDESLAGLGIVADIQRKADELLKRTPPCVSSWMADTSPSESSEPAQPTSQTRRWLC